MSKTIIQLESLKKWYPDAKGKLHVLNGVDLTLHEGEVVALMGQSGAGKSTMLHIIGLLDRASSGKVSIHGQDCSKLSDRRRTEMRRQEIGFVYQFHHLLSEFTALENVMLAGMTVNNSKREIEAQATLLLEKVGLKNRLSHRPSQLSGGEQQRVAIARALVNKPSIVLADEPTGNLDMKTSEMVFELFLSLSKELNTCLLIATHNPILSQRMNHVITLENGRI